MDADTRFLTPEGKAAAIAEWKAVRTKPRPDGDLGGKGWPDLEIIPLVDALNDFPGICTLQSCAGHGEDRGHLWVWLSVELSSAFNQWGHVLARLPGIERVWRDYSSWGQEIAVVEFDHRYQEASESVLVFFRALVATCDSYQRVPSLDTRCQAHR